VTDDGAVFFDHDPLEECLVHPTPDPRWCGAVAGGRVLDELEAAVEVLLDRFGGRPGGREPPFAGCNFFGEPVLLGLE
jgi:hypothetical protein